MRVLSGVNGCDGTSYCLISQPISQIFFTYLCEGQRLRGGSASPTNTLFHQSHGEFLMGNTMSSITHIFCFPMSDMFVDSHKHILEAFRGIVHEAQLESLLVEEALRQGPAKGIWRQGTLL